MAGTLLIDTATWDLVLDSRGNIAMASEPYSLAQDAASAIKTFLGEVYFDTTIGLPYFDQILGHTPPLSLLKTQFAAAAKTVPNVAAAQCFLSDLSNRTIAGQVQVVSASSGRSSAANFAIINPQGTG